VKPFRDNSNRILARLKLGMKKEDTATFADILFVILMK